MENIQTKSKTKIVVVQFSPLGNRYEFFCPWEETQVGDFVVGRGELGDAVGRVMKIQFRDDEASDYSELSRKATNNEAYDCEEVFNLKHKHSREKKFIKGNGEVVVRKIDELGEDEGSSSDLNNLMGILRFICIGIGLLIFMKYKEEILEMVGL
ncbi:MAG: hypothetical protein Q4D21_06245 [Phascolarctobacterium sp.]|nr:hypothetical protein [Phascolarctobacterium sp.]